MYISRLIIAGYAFWVGYQVHKHDLINRAIEQTKELMSEISYQNGRAFAEGIAREGVIQIARPPKVTDAAG